MKRIIPIILVLLLLAACAAKPGGAATCPHRGGGAPRLAAGGNHPAGGRNACSNRWRRRLPNRWKKRPPNRTRRQPRPWRTCRRSPGRNFWPSPPRAATNFEARPWAAPSRCRRRSRRRWPWPGASGITTPEGTCLTFYYVPENGRYPLTMFYLVAATPRAVFFRPGSWYNSTQTGHSIVAIGEDSLLFTMGPLGGSEIGREDPLWEDYTETFSAAGAALRQTITVDSPSSLPTLDPAALSDAAQALTAQGNGTMTREAAAQLAFDLLKAENKAQEYPLPYTDVTPRHRGRPRHRVLIQLRPADAVRPGRVRAGRHKVPPRRGHHPGGNLPCCCTGCPSSPLPNSIMLFRRTWTWSTGRRAM